VQNGGTLIEQYNRANVTDAYGPYPAQISNNRITDEHAPVQCSSRRIRCFTTPNKITARPGTVGAGTGIELSRR
jgi:hypothetical protein